MATQPSTGTRARSAGSQPLGGQAHPTNPNATNPNATNPNAARANGAEVGLGEAVQQVATATREFTQRRLELLALDVETAIDRTKREAALYGVAGMAALTAWIVIVAMVAVLLTRWMPPSASLGITAAANIVLALVLVAVARAQHRSGTEHRGTRD